MTTLTHKRILAFGIATAVALSIATPSFAKTQPSAAAPDSEYINKPCVTDEGYGRWLPCGAGAS